MTCVKGGSLGQHQVRDDKAMMRCPGRGCEDHRAQGLVSVHSRQRTFPGLREHRYDVGGLGASEHGWQLLHMALVEARGQGCALGMRDSGSAGLRSLQLSECFGVALKVLAPGGSLTDWPTSQ